MYVSTRYNVLAMLLAAALVGQMCSAQDWQSGGVGNSPMAPMTQESRGDFQRPMVPGPPLQPTAASRPASWPGTGPQASPWSPPAAPAALAPRGELQPCGRIIARVGSDAILESDVIGAVNEFLETNKNRIPPEQVDEYREALLRQRVKGVIETKLIYQDAKRTIPSERLPEIEKKLANEFDEHQLEKLMKKSGATTAHEFDQKLRSLGTSLDRERRAFVERSLAQGWVAQQVKHDEGIIDDQMVVVYYQEHLAEFTTPARAQWEELMVRFSNPKYPTKVAAFDAIARMGNQVLHGAPLAEVAKANSDGATASKGGQCGWNTKGALACAALDAALFTLPIGQLSPIIEGPTGYHIIRVTKREDVVVRPYVDAQVDIKKKIVQERSEKQFQDYMAKLEARTPVWTFFDGASGKLEVSSRDERTQR